MAKALSEIHKVDPSFNKEAFIRECEVDIIPTVLEVRMYVHVMRVVKCCKVKTRIHTRCIKVC